MAKLLYSADGQRIWWGTSTDHRTHLVVDDGAEKQYSLCRLVIDRANETPTDYDNLCRSCREAAVERLHMWIGTPDEWNEYSQRVVASSEETVRLRGKGIPVGKRWPAE